MDAHQHTIPRDSDMAQGYALSGKVMLTSVITLFVVVLLIVCFHLYTRWFVRRAHRRHRRRLFQRAAVNRLSLSTARGLHPSLLTSLPTFVYNSSSSSSGSAMECAVCLSEFEEGETGRVLPKCSHSFHIECIDTWFKSRSSCPLCRAPVRPEPGRVDREEVAVQVSNGESGAGSSTGSESLRLPPPVECPRKTPEVVVEMGGNWSERHRMAGSNSRVNDDGLSLKRFVSI